MIAKLIRQYENYSKFGVSSDKFNPRSLLIEPHGGILINRIKENADFQSIESLPKLHVDERIILDCEQIAQGVYSPIKGFMNREEVESVLEHQRLLEGHVWTLPILLQTHKDHINDHKSNDTIALVNQKTNEIFALLKIEEIFEMDLDSLTKRMFGTDSRNHPGVNQIKKFRKYFCGWSY